MMIILCDLTHYFEPGLSRLDFQNEYIRGITSDITSVQGTRNIIQAVEGTSCLTLRAWAVLLEAFRLKCIMQKSKATWWVCKKFRI